jgi:hypothetical protein
VNELVAWCFHSPRRLLVVVGVLLVVVLGLGAGIRALLPHDRVAAASPPAAAGSVVGSGPAIDAAVTFTRAWAAKPASATPEQWRRTLSALVTPDLARGLAVTDPSSLPGGAPAGQPLVRFASVSSSLVEVPLSTGARVLVTVVLVDGHWLAQDVQPAAGDNGDVAGNGAGNGAGAGAGASPSTAAG